VSIEPALLETRHKLLEGAGYTAFKASSWTEFEQACGAHHLDLILLGQSLPPSLKHDMDEFARKQCPRTKVAELYLYAQSIPSEYAFNASVPDPEELLGFVKRTLGDKN